jgi:hypothetical protein
VNFADVHDATFLKVCGVPVDLQTAQFPSRAIRARLVARDPASLAIYFDVVMQALIEAVFGFEPPARAHQKRWVRRSEGGVFGLVRDFYCCCECQVLASSLHVCVLPSLVAPLAYSSLRSLFIHGPNV